MSRLDSGTNAGTGRARTRAGAGSHRAVSTFRWLLAGRRALVAALTAALVLSALGVAAAEVLKGKPDQLIEAGPVSDAVGGYPTWYRDAGFNHDGTSPRSVDLEPCLGDRDPMCLPAPAPDPSKPMDVASGNFPDEFFYYHNAAAGLVSNGGNDVLFESALEGAWSAEEVNPGDQVVFGRIRIRVEGLRAGAEYTVTHPQGAGRLRRRRRQAGDQLHPGHRGPAGELHRRVQEPRRAVPAVGAERRRPQRPADRRLHRRPERRPPRDREPVRHELREDHRPCGRRAHRQPGRHEPEPVPRRDVERSLQEDCIYTELFNLMGRESKSGGVETNRASYARAADGTTGLRRLRALEGQPVDASSAMARAPAPTPLRDDAAPRPPRASTSPTSAWRRAPCRIPSPW